MYDYRTDYVGNQMVKNVTRVQFNICIYIIYIYIMLYILRFAKYIKFSINMFHKLRIFQNSVL